MVAVPAPDRLNTATARDGAISELLLCRVEDYLFALPTASVDRVLRMAALTPWVDGPPGVAGTLNLHGSRLVVVDPRNQLGLPAAPARLDQRLVVLRADSRFVLWVDEVDRVVGVPTRELDALDSGTDQPLVPYVARIKGAVTWVLSPAALDPGQLVEAAA